jgi:hypothetical protein
MFANIRRERAIRALLRRISRQRVIGFDGRRNAWIVERAPSPDEDALHSCRIRGWVEPLPHGAVYEGATEREQLYRLTGPGWDAIHRTHSWVVSTLVIAMATLFATILGIWLNANH